MDGAMSGKRKMRRDLNEEAFNTLAGVYRKWQESPHVGERETARNLFEKAAVDHGMSVKELADAVQAYITAWAKKPARQFGQSNQSTPPPPGSQDTPPSFAEAIDALREMIQSFAVLPKHADLIVALWAAHTLVYRYFPHTPRLVLSSAEPESGKTTVLNALAVICNNGKHFGEVSPAGIFQHIDAMAGNATLLIDEADACDFKSNSKMRSIYNEGHRRDGSVLRGSASGQPRSYQIFAPMACGGIDIDMSFARSMLGRSIVFLLLPATPAESAALQKLGDPNIRRQLELFHLALSEWAQRVERREIRLNTNPKMPRELRNRVADNWRPLLGVADAASPELGALARKVAVAISGGQRPISPGVIMIFDCRTAFDSHRVDRIFSRDIVEDFVANPNDIYRGDYERWRGKNGDRPPRRLTPGALAEALKRYGIFPRSVRLPGKRETAKGYHRGDFGKLWKIWADAWKAFCDGNGNQDQNDDDGQSDQPATLRLIRGGHHD
jgi:hypothetical protein